MHRAIRFLVCALSLAAVFHAGATMAATVEVGTCSHFPQFSTIQAAVTAASPGSTVLVCPGTYPEQVTVNKQLTLQGARTASASGAVITSPVGGVVGNATSLSSGSPLAAQVLVQNANDVDITNLTVDGSNNGLASCSPILIGIFYQNASGTISHTAALNQALGGSSTGCGSGLAIFAQSGSGGSSDLHVEDSVVQGYQKNGITGNEIGTSVSVTSNSVVGQGPTSGAAENGIQVGYGAKGQVMRNTVIDDVWAPDVVTDPGDAASGILVYAASGVTVDDNRVGNTQFGIILVSDPTVQAADRNSVTWNRVSGTHLFDGIDVCSNNNSIHDNVVARSDRVGIHLDSSCTNADGSNTGKGNRVQENVVNSACAGILVGSLTSTGANSIFGNSFFNVNNTILSGDQCTTTGATPMATVAANAVMSGSQGTRQASPVRP